ncbi:hypothetical protein SK066_05580 [Paenibacillus hunanensis]|uniref:hypothetical protein n=1 Tax=Paenibacillus hunanensis TaxID=539262 RepID=UPI002A6A3946|nr:hypothetical protein [Paenibacillus hunanensis]WPP42423.1 hypothetical protein SK066_05580 [Paenibacillus hunanensis]
MYTATQKTTYSYGKNGNLVSKQVEQGNYSSVVNLPAPTPAPEPVTDPTSISPPVSTPAKAGVRIMYTLDSTT